MAQQREVGGRAHASSQDAALECFEHGLGVLDEPLAQDGTDDLVDLGQADAVLELEDDLAASLGRLDLPVPVEAVEDALEGSEADSRSSRS